MSAATVDPSLDALVPRSSPRRNVAMVVLGLAVVVGLWFVPPLLRPNVQEYTSSSSGGWTVFSETGQVLFTTTLLTGGPGTVTVSSVPDVPGAHVLAAWLADADAVERIGGLGPSALDAAATMPGVGDGTRLPQGLGAGTEASLVVVWQVDDCTHLTRESVSVVLRSPLGVRRVQDLGISPFRSEVGAEHGGLCRP